MSETQVMPASNDDTQPGWKALVGSTLRERTDPSHAGKTAALRFAAVPATEVSAYGYTEAYLGDLPEQARIGVRRAVGICAKNARSPQPQAYLSVGASLALLHRKEFGFTAGSFSTDGLRRNAMTSQVDALPLLDLESAASALDLLIGRCSAHDIPVDFFGLARTLMKWGNGMSADSREVRARLVRDFYSFNPTSSK